MSSSERASSSENVPGSTVPEGADDHTATTAATRIPSGQNTTRENVLEREKESFGGIKFGSAFFGWLTATGAAVLLAAIAAAIVSAIGVGNQVDLTQVANASSSEANTAGIVGAIVLAVILLLAYYCGGYVAGRMARFDGAKQGVAVWLWAVIIAVVLTVAGLIAGSQFDILGNINGFPRLPFSGQELTTGGVISVVVGLLLSLLGAVLGGLAGMRFHRRVDRAGLGR